VNAPLVLALPLIEGETLSGYVSRSAQQYETTPRDFCSDLGMRWPFLCSGRDDQLERLSWLIGEDLEKLKASRTRKIGIGHYRVGQAVASTGVLRRTAVRLCPRCVISSLADGGPSAIFQMLEWTVLSLPTCEKHGCALITLPSSSDTHTTYDFVARVLEQIDMVRQASEQFSLYQPTEFEKYTRRRIWLGSPDDWLKDFDLNQLYRGCLALGAALVGHKAEAVTGLSVAEERDLCQSGFEKLVAGPDVYRSALKQRHRQSTAERPYYTADMGSFYHWLREVHKAPALRDLMNATCQHVFATYPTPLGKGVFGQRPKRETWLTMDEARKRSGFGVTFLKQLLGHINGLPEEEALKRTDVHIDEVAQAQAYWANLMNLSDAAKALGIGAYQVKNLQNRGVLDTVQVTSSLRYVFREQVSDLLKNVGHLPEILANRPVVPLSEFCRAKGVGVARIVEMWAHGCLEGRLSRGDGVGLQALEVDWDALCDKQPISLTGDLQLPDVASYLKISIISVRHLRDSGYLTQVPKRNPDTNHLKNYITQRSIQEFEDRYVTLGQLAAQQGVASIHLARRLDHDRVSTVSCSGKLVRVYEKSDVLVCDRKTDV